MNFEYGFGMGFHMLDVLFGIVVVLVIGIYVMTMVRGIGEWSKNNHSPKITVPVCIVSKRTHFSRRRAGKQHYSRSSTNYYVTFQLGSGDRMELRVSGEEYGILVEGDRGELSFQGSRYIGFERS